MKTIALFGMPNCGKSSLFNLLSGGHAPTGNRAGVTVTAQSVPLPLPGVAEPCRLTDLPGIRSLSPSSADERAALAALDANHAPDLLLFVCDATDLPRQRELFTGLLSFLSAHRLCIPILFVLNFCDELKAFPDGERVREILGLPSAAVSARTCRGIDRLKRQIAEQLAAPCSRCASLCRCPRIGEAEFDRLERFLGGVREPLLQRTRVLDNILLRPLTGIPLFLLLTAGILFAVFGAPGDFLCDRFRSLLLDPLFAWIGNATASLPPFWHRFLCGGILGGVGAVLDFLPRLTLLFFLQSLLEQTGALARLSRLADRPLSAVGLRGDAMTPLLLGFGCNVPAILCTRSMKDGDAAKRCASCLPVVACSARMPLCFAVADAFFGNRGWIVCALIWVYSALFFLLLCALFRRLSGARGRGLRHEDPLPRWRFPSPTELLSSLLENLSHFLLRVGGTVFFLSVLIFFLTSVGAGFAILPEGETDGSFLAAASRAIAPLLAPLGFGNWQTCAVLLSGFGAKEASLSTLGILLGTGSPVSASLASSGFLSARSAVPFLLFYSTSFPCAATVAALRAEKRGLLPLLPIFLFSYLFAMIGALLCGAVPGR